MAVGSGRRLVAFAAATIAAGFVLVTLELSHTKLVTLKSHSATIAPPPPPSESHHWPPPPPPQHADATSTFIDPVVSVPPSPPRRSVLSQSTGPPPPERAASARAPDKLGSPSKASGGGSGSRSGGSGSRSGGSGDASSRIAPAGGRGLPHGNQSSGASLPNVSRPSGGGGHGSDSAGGGGVSTRLSSSSSSSSSAGGIDSKSKGRASSMSGFPATGPGGSSESSIGNDGTAEATGVALHKQAKRWLDECVNSTAATIDQKLPSSEYWRDRRHFLIYRHQYCIITRYAAQAASVLDVGSAVSRTRLALAAGERA